jgi:DNA polymerase III epsilon subunit family exonuclease
LLKEKMDKHSSIYIEDVEFTIFDTETTGLDPESGDRIVEVAAIRVKGGKKIDSFETLVNPKRPISEAAFKVNRITADMLKDAPGMEIVMPRLLDFIKGSCLCSYNASFDLGFLNNELRLMGKEALAGVLVVDILKMAKRLLPKLERHALWFVADTLGIRIEQKHRALADVELTRDVFNRLKEVLAAKGIFDFANFSQLFGITPGFLQDAFNQKISRIQEAISLGVKLKIRYIARSNAEVTEREVVPKEIKQDKNHSYLVGYCCLRKDERNFRVDSILHLEIT